MASTLRRDLQVALVRFIRHAKKVELVSSESVPPGEATVMVDCREVGKVITLMAAEEQKQNGREQAEADMKKLMKCESFWNFTADIALACNSVELGSVATSATRKLLTEGGTASLRDLKRNWSLFEESNLLQTAVRELTVANIVLHKVELEMGTSAKGEAARERKEEGVKPQKVQKKDEEKREDETAEDGEEGVKPQKVQKKDEEKREDETAEEGEEGVKPQKVQKKDEEKREDETAEEEGVKPQKVQKKGEEKTEDETAEEGKGGVKPQKVQKKDEEKREDETAEEGEEGVKPQKVQKKDEEKREDETAEEGEEGVKPQKVQKKDEEKREDETAEEGEEAVKPPKVQKKDDEKKEDEDEEEKDKEDDEGTGGLWEFLKDLLGF